MPFSSTLKGIKILDLTSNLPGPLATQILGDFGADVIKIESIQGDNIRSYPPFIETESVLNLLLNRNKRSLAIDLKTKEGLEIFYKLVKWCDIVIEGFRPGVTKRLKIDFNTLKNLQPRIIFCSINGFGDNNNRSGHDINYMGLSGIINLTGPRELPVVPGVPLGDIGGGSLPAVISILAALIQRKETPQYINIAITDHLIPYLTVAASTYLASLGCPSREDHTLSGYYPFYRLFRTKDQEVHYISFGPLETKFWKNFCIGIKREDLIGKQFDFKTLEVELPQIFIQKTQLEWDEWFKVYDVPGAPVLTLEQALNVNNRLKIVDHPSLGKIKIIKSPFLDYDTPITIPPQLGENTKEILAEFGYTNDELEFLRSKDVITFPR